MPQPTPAEARSPWYEAFAPHAWTATPWQFAAEPQESPEPPAPSDTSDDRWVTEAIFDSYND